MFENTVVNPIFIERNDIVKSSQNPIYIDCVGIGLHIDETLELQPRESKNIKFSETVSIPTNMMMTIYLRSSFTRIGLFQSSGIFEPGYGMDDSFGPTGATTGTTLFNASNSVIKIERGFRIAQAVFFKVQAAKKYDGHYNKKENGINSQYEGKI
jgi:deoxycytidine triphosphate deaminase